jgi:hypothetical protein
MLSQPFGLERNSPMKRQAIRGLVLLGLLTLVADSTVRGQPAPADKITVRDRKDGSTKTYDGQFKVGPGGFQVFGGEKFDKVIATITPDDIIKVVIGELPSVERSVILGLNAKEEKKDYDGARVGYQDLFKKSAGAPEKSKRYLQFKVAYLNNKIVDDLDADKGWKAKAEDAVKTWADFLQDYKSGWELWPAVRSCTRLQIELGKHDDAARTWSRLSKNTDMPPDAKLEASLQEIDLQIRAGKEQKGQYSTAAVAASELLKTAAGPKKDRLVIYEIAAKAGADGKPLDGIDKIKAEMEKTKDASVHATGFSMMGELYLADGKKPRDAMWMFLWVETVMNQDKDEALKAISRLAEMFEAQMDEDQSKKYRDKLKRFRNTF